MYPPHLVVKRWWKAKAHAQYANEQLGKNIHSCWWNRTYEMEVHRRRILIPVGLCAHFLVAWQPAYYSSQGSESFSEPSCELRSCGVYVNLGEPYWLRNNRIEWVCMEDVTSESHVGRTRAARRAKWVGMEAGTAVHSFKPRKEAAFWFCYTCVSLYSIKN